MATRLVAVGPARVAWATALADLHPAVQFSLLAEPDQLRVRGFDAVRRRRFQLGRLLVHALVAGEFPRATAWQVVSGRCQRCRRVHLGVRVDGVPATASISYAGDLVVAALSPTVRAGRLGVDVEADVADATRLADLSRLLPAGPDPVLRRWTRTEAVLKADGRGLLLDPASVQLAPGRGRIAGDAAGYRVADVPGPPGFLVSLAWSEPEVWAIPGAPASPPAGSPTDAR